MSAGTGVPIHETVRALLDSDDYRSNERGLQFVRRVVSRLVLQYAVVLIIISPFCLIEPFKVVAGPFYMLFSALAFVGMLASIYVALYTDDIARKAKISLFTFTIFVALTLGSRLMLVSWSNYALVAVGQAVCNFTLILAILQFDSKQLKWFDWKSGGLIALSASSLWVILMRELDEGWIASALVPAGGCSIP